MLELHFLFGTPPMQHISFEHSTSVMRELRVPEFNITQSTDVGVPEIAQSNRKHIEHLTSHDAPSRSRTWGSNSSIVMLMANKL